MDEDKELKEDKQEEKKKPKTAAAKKREREKKKLEKNSVTAVTTTVAPKKPTSSKAVQALKAALEKQKAEEAARLAEIEAEKKRQAEEKAKREALEKKKEEERKRKLEEKRKHIEELKKQGKYLAPSQRKKLTAAWEQLKLCGISTTSTTLTPEVGVTEKAETGKGEGKEEKKILSPPECKICCVLGHVDAGKTKFLDKLCHTNVQAKEAGYITQKLSVAYVPVPSTTSRALLMIDTPGHEVFTGLRKLGSKFCDVAVLVVDIMHGFKPQTFQSLSLLKEFGVPFAVALTKLDLIFGWQYFSGCSLRQSLVKQKLETRQQFQSRVDEIITSFASQGFNTNLLLDSDFSPEEKSEEKEEKNLLVPISSITGEGMEILVNILATLSLRKKYQEDDELDNEKKLNAAILDVSTSEGLGCTADVVIRSGTLKRGDKIIVAGWSEPIITTVRNLLPVSDTTSTTSHGVESVSAIMVAKIVAPDLDKCVPGSLLYIITDEQTTEDVEELKTRAQENVDSLLSKFSQVSKDKNQGTKLIIQADTLGSLEALIDLLGTTSPVSTSSTSSSIPCGGATPSFNIVSVGIGPVQKKHITAATINGALLLAFNVEVSSEMEELAKEEKVKIMAGDVIYRLVDQVKKFVKEEKEKLKTSLSSRAIFPCLLEVLGVDSVYHKSDPVIVGVKILAGTVKVGTPLCANNGGKIIDLGTVVSIQSERREELKQAKAETGKVVKVCLKIQATSSSSSAVYGRHWDYRNQLVSKLSRESIDLLKQNFKEDLTMEDWKLVIKLKEILLIK